MSKKIHLLLIDPLEKLVIKKDSTLLLALSLKQAGHKTFILFLPELCWKNKGPTTLVTHAFHGKVDPKTHYIKEFVLDGEHEIPMEDNVVIHMRLDPPFDGRYLKTLWLLRSLKAKGVAVVNDPEGICLYNEKLTALVHESSLPSYVGSGVKGLSSYLADLCQNSADIIEYVIIKPLDLYQGYGVQKVAAQETVVLSAFTAELEKSGGPLVVQPFAKSVEAGETRAVYFKGKELGSIIKVPPKGQFLANIAQGASFSACDLSAGQKRTCEQIVSDLGKKGIDWIAFDLLGEAVSEVNITCPGLLVEVSNAHGKNLADVITLML